MIAVLSQDEIKDKLHTLRYRGKWSFRKIAREAGISPSTIQTAMYGHIGEQTQRRLSAILPLLPEICPKKKFEAPKRQYSVKKRHLIRYYNLCKWLDVIEQENGVQRDKFIRKKQYDMTKAKAGFVCAMYDYQMKYHLLSLFGERLRSKKVVMADCYPAEKWIERINKVLPGVSTLLFKKLTTR